MMSEPTAADMDTAREVFRALETPHAMWEVDGDNRRDRATITQALADARAAGRLEVAKCVGAPELENAWHRLPPGSPERTMLLHLYTAHLAAL